jgi:hypothetical protein
LNVLAKINAVSVIEAPLISLAGFLVEQIDKADGVQKFGWGKSEEYFTLTTPANNPLNCNPFRYSFHPVFRPCEFALI